jgi:hypothetical protein
MDNLDFKRGSLKMKFISKSSKKFIEVHKSYTFLDFL